MTGRVVLSALVAAASALAQQQLQLAAHRPGQTIDFGAVPNASAKTVTLQLTNPGPDDAVLTTLSTDGAAFSLPRGLVGAVIPAGRSLEVSLAFRPHAAGRASGQLWVRIATPASSSKPVLQPMVEYDLAGSATPRVLSLVAAASTTPAVELDAEPQGMPYQPGQAFDFGTVAPGVHKTQTFQLKNTGLSDVQILSISADTTLFQVSWIGGTPVLPAGQTVDLQVAFAPQASGAVNGNLNVKVGVPASSLNQTVETASFGLTGTGASAAPTPTPTPSPTPTPTPTPTPSPTPTPTATPTPSWPTASIVIEAQPVSPGDLPQYAISIQFSSPLPTGGGGLLKMQVSGMGDPTRGFIGWDGTFAPSEVSFDLYAGDTWARFDGQHQTILFQVGGTLANVALQFTATSSAGTQLATGQLTASPMLVDIDSVTVCQVGPSCTAPDVTNGILVTANGLDNTQTASQATFTFYDTSGNQIGAPISVDATQAFAGYFGPNDTGAATGLFALQQAFAVTGDVCGIGKVVVSIQNTVQGTLVPGYGAPSPCTMSQ
jgi:hypothetical protein